MLGTALNLPRNFCNGAFYLVGVLEDHEGFGGDFLAHVLGLLAGEVFLEEIDFVVLLDATFSCPGKVSSGRGEAEGRVSVELLGVPLHVLLISVVHVLGPPTDTVIHSTIFGLYALCVNGVDLEGGDVVKVDFVGVPQDVVFTESWIGLLLTNHLGSRLLKLGMSSKLTTFLLVLVCVRHSTSNFDSFS